MNNHVTESLAVWQGAKRTDTVSHVCAKRPSLFSVFDRSLPNDWGRVSLLDDIGYLRAAQTYAAAGLYQGAYLQPVFSAAVRSLSDDCRSHLHALGGMAGEW